MTIDSQNHDRKESLEKDDPRVDQAMKLNEDYGILIPKRIMASQPNRFKCGRDIDFIKEKQKSKLSKIKRKIVYHTNYQKYEKCMVIRSCIKYYSLLLVNDFYKKIAEKKYIDDFSFTIIL